MIKRKCISSGPPVCWGTISFFRDAPDTIPAATTIMVTTAVAEAWVGRCGAQSCLQLIKYHQCFLMCLASTLGRFLGCRGQRLCGYFKWLPGIQAVVWAKGVSETGDVIIRLQYYAKRQSSVHHQQMIKNDSKLWFLILLLEYYCFCKPVSVIVHAWFCYVDITITLFSNFNLIGPPYTLAGKTRSLLISSYPRTAPFTRENPCWRWPAISSPQIPNAAIVNPTISDARHGPEWGWVCCGCIDSASQ